MSSPPAARPPSTLHYYTHTPDPSVTCPICHDPVIAEAVLFSCHPNVPLCSDCVARWLVLERNGPHRMARCPCCRNEVSLDIFREEMGRWEGVGEDDSGDSGDSGDDEDNNSYLPRSGNGDNETSSNENDLELQHSLEVTMAFVAEAMGDVMDNVDVTLEDVADAMGGAMDDAIEVLEEALGGYLSGSDGDSENESDIVLDFGNRGEEDLSDDDKENDEENANDADDEREEDDTSEDDDTNSNNDAVERVRFEPVQ